MGQLGIKAETLAVMYGKLNTAKVLPQFTFSVAGWRQGRENVTRRFSELDWNANMIVRSSCRSEDTQTASMAGKFEPIADVIGIDAFQGAVDRVIAVYGSDRGDDQVLVQPMLGDVKMRGVAFTLDPGTHGNYFVINYDETGKTSVLTSGTGKNSYLHYHFKNTSKTTVPEKLRQLIEAFGELESFFEKVNLDVEFAVTNDGVFYILQVRTLCLSQERIGSRQRNLLALQKRFDRATSQNRSCVDKRWSTAYYSELNSNLFWICVWLSMEKAENILPCLWEMFETDRQSMPDIAVFTEKMKELLAYGSEFTSQELFVMIHNAYMYMLGNAEKGDFIKDKIIYWEPHYVDQDKKEDCTRWLGTKEVQCDIINVVRNICMQNGASCQDYSSQNLPIHYYNVLCHLSLDKRKYEYGKRCVVIFEELKYNPQETLMKICNNWEIGWEDLLMDTTWNGKRTVYNDGVHRVGRFGLGPVYNLYDGYSSEFDRLRMMIINAAWKKILICLCRVGTVHKRGTA